MLVLAQNYVVGLGYVGSKIVKNLVEISGGKYQRTGLVIERPIENTELQIIDMGVEDESTRRVLEKLIMEHGFVTDDQIYEVVIDEKYYKRDAMRLARNDFTALRRYYSMFVEPILAYLGPGKGVQRYRPLARHFITRRDSIGMMRRYLEDDVRVDLRVGVEPKESIRVVYVLSAGGGFGSGSLIEINTLLSRLLEANGLNYITKAVLNIPAGLEYFKLEPEQTPIVDGERGSLASSAALLLELLYLHGGLIRRGPSRRRYEDALLKLTMDYAGIKLDGLRGVDEIIVSTFAGIPGSGADEVFELHDTEMGRFLYPETRAELGQLRENIHNQFSNYMAEVAGRVTDFAKELLIPVTVVGAFSIQVSPERAKGLIEEIKALSEKIKKLEEERKRLDQQIKQQSDLQEALEREQRVKMGEIDEISKERIRTSAIEEIRRIEAVGRSISTDLIPAMKRTVDKVRDDVVTGLNVDPRGALEAVRTLSTVVSDALNKREVADLKNEFQSRMSKIKETLGKQDLNKSDIVDLVKNVLILEIAYSALTYYKNELEGIKKDKINTTKEAARPGYLDRLFNKHKCNVHRLLGDISERISKGIQSLVLATALNDADNMIKKAWSKHEEFENTLRKEIGNIADRIKSAEKRKKELEDDLSKVNSELAEAEHTLKGKYRDLSRVLLTDIQRYCANLLEHIDIEKFVDVLRRKGIEHIGVSTVLEAIKEMNERLANNVMGTIKQRMHGLSYFAYIEVEDANKLGKILGMEKKIIEDTFSEERYVVASSDNERLAKELAGSLIPEEKLEERCFIIKDAKTSFITYVKRKLVIPLQVREIREALRAFFEEVDRYIETKGEGQEGGGLTRVKEYRGLAYMTLDVESKDIIEYLERVKESLDKFEGELKKLIR